MWKGSLEGQQRDKLPHFHFYDWFDTEESSAKILA